MLSSAFLVVFLTVVQLQVVHAAIIPHPDCGVTMGCCPESCPPGGCVGYHVSWEHAGEYMRFVLTQEDQAGDRWIAMGWEHAPQTAMLDGSIVMCKSDGGATSVQIGHNAGYAFTPLSTNYGLQNATMNHNGTTIVCSFDRIKNATQNEDKIFDLDQPLYLVHAHGRIDSGIPNYHGPGSRGESANAINFLNVSQLPEMTGPIVTNAPTIVTNTPQPGGSVSFDPACGVTKGCFSDCRESGCSFLVTWSNMGGDSIAFEISAQVNSGANSWFAIGFSHDKSMGDDSVVLCLISGGGSVAAQTGYNTHHSYGVITPNTLGLSDVSGSFVNSVLTCRFTRMTNISGQANFFNLRQRWNLLFAHGATIGGFPTKHPRTPVVSEGTVDFLSTNLLEGETVSYILVKVHGSLMITAWVLFASVGIFMARYLKPLWPNSTILGQKVWFQIHRACMVTVLVLTVIAFIIIFVESDGYAEASVSDENHSFATYHPILGIVVTSLTVINPIMALFRCAPDHKRRPLFNFYHWFIGTSAYIVAAITIIFGCYLDKAQMPESAKYVAIAYICLFVFVGVILEIYLFSRKQKKGNLEFELKPPENGSASVSDSPVRHVNQEDAPISKFVLCFQFVAMLGFAITLIVLLAMEKEE